MTGLLLSLARDAQVAALRAESVTFAVALANELVVRHAAALLIVECDQELAAKSLPYLQCQGRCLMHQKMTYTH